MMYTCDVCAKNGCKTGDISDSPLNCPCTMTGDQENIKTEYMEKSNLTIAHNSALVESSGYCQQTRIEEIISFARRCGFKKLGVAFCIGLKDEAKTFCSILRKRDFEVNSVVCKNGSIPKAFINIKEDEKVRPNTYEAMCNPIGQAYFLNDAGTELNILLGLCVGHDSLFIKYSKAPVTVFAVKDRVLGHNPLAAIYTAGSYYKAKLKNQEK